MGNSKTLGFPLKNLLPSLCALAFLASAIASTASADVQSDIDVCNAKLETEYVPGVSECFNRTLKAQALVEKSKVARLKAAKAQFEAKFGKEGAPLVKSNPDRAQVAFNAYTKEMCSYQTDFGQGDFWTAAVCILKARDNRLKELDVQINWLNSVLNGK